MKSTDDRRWTHAGGCLSLDEPAIMGIVNVTPDSFSDGGQFLSVDAAVAHALTLESAGANLLDIGGESTRPGSQPVSPDTEVARVLPVLRALRPRTKLPLSVDTTKAEVARQALLEGADIINDISGLSFEPHLAEHVARAGAGIVVMHTPSRPATMQTMTDYPDVVASVRQHLRCALDAAEAAGIAPHQVVLDPGFGFGKTVVQNFQLLRSLEELLPLGRPLLVGMSRKRMLREAIMKISPAPRENTASERALEFAGVGAAVAALTNGASIVRVHDVAAVRIALHVWKRGLPDLI